MQALQVSQFGLSHLRLVELPRPTPAAGEVLIRVRAVSLNYRYLVVLDGSYLPNLPMPFIPLSEAAGEVVAVDESVKRWRPGDQVITHYSTTWLSGEMNETHQAGKLGGPLPGMLREYAVLPEDALLATPPHLSDAEAATLPIAALTAWNALLACGLLPGQTVLLQGTGGVSLFALKFAGIMGLRTVLTSSQDEKLTRARQLGAHQTINYRSTPNWGEAARALGGGRGVDAVLEVGGTSTLTQSLHAVRHGGTVAVIGFLGGVGSTDDLTRVLIGKRLRLQGLSVGSRADFEAMNRALAAHCIHPQIDRVFAFHEAADAFRHLSSGAAFGKVVIAL